jgi:cell wall-associated NlpC family hydrolase
MPPLTPHQQKMIDLGLSLSAKDPPRVRRALLAAMAVESNFRNVNYGDRDSLGVLQQRPSQGWGAPGNPRQDINQFLARARAANRGFSGTFGQLAQSVQRSAFPERYDQRRAQVNQLLGRSSVPRPRPTRAVGTTMAVDSGGMIDAQALAQSILGGKRASEAVEEAVQAQIDFGSVPRMPRFVAEGKARQFGGTTQDFGDAPAGNPKIAQALAIAKQQIGKPYVWGATNPKVGFDCSGLIEYAFEQAGIKTPGRLTTGPMSRMGKKVAWRNVQPGDWIVRDSGGSGHVVMYVGNGQVIAAPRTGEVIQYQPLSRFASDKRYAVRRWHG